MKNWLLGMCVLVVVIVSAVFAADKLNIENIVSGIGGAKTVAAGLGISVLGLIGIIGLLRGAITESVEAVRELESFVRKYQGILQDSNSDVRRDFDKAKKEIDEALEAYAKILDRLQLRDLARKLRNVI